MISFDVCRYFAMKFHLLGDPLYRRRMVRSQLCEFAECEVSANYSRVAAFNDYLSKVLSPKSDHVLASEADPPLFN